MPTPIDRVLHIRTYRFSIQYGTNREGRVAWDSDKILVEKQTFTLVDLQLMVKGLYKTVRLQLLQELLLLDVNKQGTVQEGTTQLPDLKLEELRNNHTEIIEG